MANESNLPQLDHTDPRGVEEGVTLAGYEVLEELGRGAMGVVYRARQHVLRRTVALKIIGSGRLAAPEHRARLCAAVESAARLGHPNIAQIYEFGEEKGSFFFSMEWIDGPALDTLMTGEPWETHIAALLVEKLARALHFSHERGIVHGDLKPANILLEAPRAALAAGEEPGEDAEEPEQKQDSGRSPRAGAISAASELQPKITDIGLARQMASGPDPDDSTCPRHVHRFQAPEIIRGQTSRVGPATDVYSLGVILYELITGRPPLHGATPEETAELTSRVEPVPLSRLRPSLAQDITTICQTCLKKNPDKRYSTAEELAEDLRRFLTGKAIVATSITSWERVKEWMRGRPGLAAGLVVSIFAACALFALILVTNARLSTEHDEAIRRRDAADQQRELDQSQIVNLQHSLYDATMREAWRAWDQNQVRRVFEELQECWPKHGQTDLRGFEWQCLWNLSQGAGVQFKNLPTRTSAVGFNATNSILAVGGEDGSVQLWSMPSGLNLATLRDEHSAVRSLDFSADGRWLATGHDDGRIRVWKMSAGQFDLAHVKSPPAENDPRIAAAAPQLKYANDSRRLVSAGPDGWIRVWDATQMTETRSWQWSAAPNAQCAGICLSPDGSTAAVSYIDGVAKAAIQISNLDEGKPSLTIEDTDRDRLRIQFIPQTRWIAGVPASGEIRMWNYDSGEPEKRIPGPAGASELVADPSQGRWLAVGYGRSNMFGAIHILAIPSGEPIDVLRGHADRLSSLAATRDGTKLVSAGRDSSIRVHDVPSQGKWWKAIHDAVWSLEILPGGGELVIGGEARIAVRNLSRGELLRETRARLPVTGLSFMPRSRTLVTMERKGTSGPDQAPGRPYLWNIDTGDQRAWSFAGGAFHETSGSAAPEPLAVAALAVSSDGQQFLTATSAKSPVDPAIVRMWELDGSQRKWEKILSEPEATVAGFSNDARVAIVGCRSRDPDLGVAVIWDCATGQEEAILRDASMLVCVEFSAPQKNNDQGQQATSSNRSTIPERPRQERLATGWSDHSIRVWDATNWQQLAIMHGHLDTPTCVTFSPDGTRLASGSLDGTVRLWNMTTYHEVAALRHRYPVRSMRFTPDGRTLIVGCADDNGAGELRFWEAHSD